MSISNLVLILKIDDYKTNTYLGLINSNRKINYIYNHTARYNNERDIMIYSKLLKVVTLPINTRYNAL